MKLAAKHQSKFTLKTDAIYDQSDIVVVLAGHSAVHQEPVSIEETITDDKDSQDSDDQTKPKKPWYKKLF